VKASSVEKVANELGPGEPLSERRSRFQKDFVLDNFFICHQSAQIELSLKGACEEPRLCRKKSVRLIGPVA